MTHPINLFDPAVRSNPYPTYAALREAPVQQVGPMGAWAVTRYADVQYALRHPELFTSTAFEAILRPAWLPHSPVADSILAKDGAEHSKLRALVTKAFTPKSIAALGPRVTAIATELAEAMRGRERLEFISAFATPLPARIIAEILGLDPALHQHFETWSDHITSITPVEPPREFADAIRKTIADMERYLCEVIEARRANPQDDIVTTLIHAEIDGDTLSDADILGMMFILLPAGFETTRHLLANAMLAFIERPNDYAELRSDPGLIPGFVEELLRHDASVQSVVRVTTQDVEIGGTKIAAGSMVMMLIGATGRDPSVYEDPERFNVRREETTSLAFGHGVHFCLGAALARLEARAGIEALVARFASFELDAAELQWNLSPTVRGPVKLPIRIVAAPES
ncbi:putative cytochrome P450 hydroxylase [Enhygromyxa salina]|uniref:Putative cytochrome P450 hydroxylase n=1 Tax=Enhygromyxa salina TaxID=215803 RepID=A0A0C2D3W5_9BACT|nr:cytochrome P450 [Enhygromyxa salina]KIG17911.1 putative cytochrome P450 hydroxylase [Enhygromyxa salina]